MDIKQIVRTTAQIVKITQLAKGNVVKIIEENSYHGPDISFAVVNDIMSDGHKTFVELVVYKKNYNEINMEVKLISADKDITLFPATKEDLTQHFETVKQKMLDSMQNKRDELAKMQKAFESVTKLIETNQVTEPTFEVLNEKNE